jgi:hypothetical protein
VTERECGGLLHMPETSAAPVRAGLGLGQVPGTGRGKAGTEEGREGQIACVQEQLYLCREGKRLKPGCFTDMLIGIASLCSVNCIAVMLVVMVDPLSRDLVQLEELRSGLEG